jgi:uncharacterized membrane protein YraQ (UPF0718 family)
MPLIIAAALFVYKTNSAVKVLRSTWSTGTIAGKPNVVDFGANVGSIGLLERSLNYFAVIWPALVFGILIAAAVSAFVSPRWFLRFLGEKSLKSQLTASLAGAPLMLCSCCVAPVFTSVVERTSRLGPALGLMLASPSLNPAALALTFMLFSPAVAIGRLATAAAAVLLIGPLTERIFGSATIPPASLDASESDSVDDNAWLRFARSVAAVSLRTLPGIFIGVLGSMLIVQWLPAGAFGTPNARLLAVIATATIAVPLALPTFLEIPLSLALLASGLPAGTAVALLFAGPAINLPSLLSVRRVSGWKVAFAVAVGVWLLAVLAGLTVG